MTKKTVNRINLKDEAGLPFVIFGIVSSEPAYKLSVLINQTLSIALKNVDPIVITRGDKTDRFSRFSDKSDLPHSSVSLIENRKEEQCLLRKFPNIDYLLVKSVESGDKLEEEEYSSLLRTVKHITAVFIIDMGRVEPAVIEAIMPNY
jgi:hypothetical protein